MIAFKLPNNNKKNLWGVGFHGTIHVTLNTITYTFIPHIFCVCDECHTPYSKYASTITHTLTYMPIRDLPGIGWSHEQKCHELHLHTCYDIQHTTLSYLQQHFGVKTGLMLHSYCTGRDDRKLENKTRQSVAVEINWGVRFQTSQQVTLFLQELSVEVFSRLIKTSQSSAGHVTVTIKKKLYEGEPGKFLGCGHCEDISRSVAPSHVITTADSLSVHVLQLYKQINIAVTDVRGIRIHLNNLKGTQMNGSAAIHNSIFEKQPPSHTTNNNKNENTNQWASRDYAYTAITGMCE